MVNDTVPGLHPTRSRPPGGRRRGVGAVGEVDPAVLDASDIDERVGVARGRPRRLADVAAAHRPAVPAGQPVYPSSDIDLAFEVDDAVPATAVEATLRRPRATCWRRSRLFDVYRGQGIAAGRRSLAYRCGSRRSTAP